MLISAERMTLTPRPAFGSVDARKPFVSALLTSIRTRLEELDVRTRDLCATSLQLMFLELSLDNVDRVDLQDC